MKLILSILICLLPLFCQAQFQMLDANSVVIINNSNQQISYELKQQWEAPWQAQTLDAQHKNTYNIESGKTLYIRVCTGEVSDDNCVVYQLEKLKRYQVYWSQGMQRWDVAEIKEQ